MQLGDIIQIGDILVSEDVITEWFCCDYAVCKGQCCISGDCGAPMAEAEEAMLAETFSSYRSLMTPEGVQAVNEKGFCESYCGRGLYTPIVKGSGACAFAHFMEDNCLCAIEKAGCVKPVSCSLYPIRVTHLTGGGLALNVHNWDICQCARDKGQRDGIRVYQFLKGPLTAAFGPQFYSELCDKARKIVEMVKTYKI